jgi:predicted hydrocarbon binding protein
MANTEMNSFNYYLLGLKETVGPTEVSKLFEALPNLEKEPEFSAEQVRSIRAKMDSLYGMTGARGVALCSGRAAFKHLLSEQSQQLGFDNEDFRFLPGGLKLKKGLVLLANWMEKAYRESIQLEALESHWVFQISNCLECGFGGMCDFTAGLLQEFMSWAGGGKFYRVSEISCQNRGQDCCRFQIDKKPIE